jgi:hypothetical protein
MLQAQQEQEALDADTQAKIEERKHQEEQLADMKRKLSLTVVSAIPASEPIEPAPTMDSIVAAQVTPPVTEPTPQVSEPKLAALLMNTNFSEILKKVSEIEGIVAAGGVPIAHSQPDQQVPLGPSSSVKALGDFMDLRDALWRNTARNGPVEVNLDSLSPVKFVVYRFGVIVTRQLRAACKIPKIQILLAKDLPPAPPATTNAFRHSYYYDQGMKTLFIRDARLDHVGEFVLVIAHAVSHIFVCDAFLLLCKLILCRLET